MSCPPVAMSRQVGGSLSQVKALPQAPTSKPGVKSSAAQGTATEASNCTESHPISSLLSPLPASPTSHLQLPAGSAAARPASLADAGPAGGSLGGTCTQHHEEH